LSGQHGVYAGPTGASRCPMARYYYRFNWPTPHPGADAGMRRAQL